MTTPWYNTVMHKLSVHKATQDDLPSLRRIINEAVEYKLTKNDEAWGTEPWTDDEVLEAIGFDNTSIVTMGNEVLGCFDLIWKDSYNWGESLGLDGQAGFLHRLAVIGSQRGNDYGARIINLVAELIRGNNRNLIRLDCRSKNESLCSYYLSLGFKRVYPSGKNNPEVSFFEKKI